MMGKKLLAICAASLLALSLVSCGSSAPQSAATEAPKATAAAKDTTKDTTTDKKAESSSTNAATAEYESAMSEYIAAFDEARKSLDDLVDSASAISTDEDVVTWCQAFIQLKDSMGSAADSLADSVADAPEEYQESHGKMAVAAASVYDAMTGFENAVDASINGDTAAFTDGLATFQSNLESADKLWKDSVE